MGFYEGEEIKIFPDTDVKQYMRYIKSRGFNSKREGNHIVVLNNIYAKYDKKLFAKILVNRRKLKGLSREDFAEKVGVTENCVFTWEIGRMMPNKYNLNKVMEIVDITERDLERCRI